MRKFTTIAIFCLLCISCWKGKLVPSVVDTSLGACEFNATIPQSSDLSLRWNEEDTITISDAIGTSSRFSIKTVSEDGLAAVFRKCDGEPSLEGSPYVAVLGGSSLTQQIYGAESISAPLVARSRTTDLEFRLSCGVLKLHLRADGVQILRISTVDDIDCNYSLSCLEPVDISAGVDFSIMLPGGGEYAEFTIVDKDGRECHIKLGEGEEVEIDSDSVTSVDFSHLLKFQDPLSGIIKPKVECDGSISVEKITMGISSKTVDNGDLDLRSEMEVDGEYVRPYSFTGAKDKKQYFSGVASWSVKSDNEIAGDFRTTCVKDVSLNELCLRVSIPHSDYPNASWTACGTTHVKGQTGFYMTVNTDEFVLKLAPNLTFTFTFPSPVDINVKNGTAKTGLWYLKIGIVSGPAVFAPEDSHRLTFNLSSNRELDLEPFSRYDIDESLKWVNLENRKDIVPGSALDFSRMGLQDAPAGKYGWLKANDGGFEFEGKPGVKQYFCGANICSNSNFISHKVADSLAVRWAVLGYNAVRIHHHDKELLTGNNWDNLDYLLSKFIEKGIYITTDLYVSRDVRYSTLGLSGSGNMTKGLYKVLVACYEPAFNDWCAFSKKFLEHVNPYTGRAYKDEPAIAMISLINEGRLNNCGEKGCPPIQEEWERWGGTGTLAYDSPGFDEFEEYLTAKVFEKCSAYVRSLGVKALLTNDNNGSHHGDMEGTTKFYDYVDNHFYIDYPDALYDNSDLPATCSNVNMAKEGGPEMMRRPYVAKAQKPYTITEWNYCGTNMYRSMSGMMVGAMAYDNGLDGVWRFAYSHLAEDVGYNPNSYPSRVNLATDPLNLASERATVCLYLRRDMEESGELVFNKTAGTMTVVSDCTCGFFSFPSAESAVAGPLRATVRKANASVWVSSLDGNTIQSSSRMLLVHLTDVQGKGVKFQDNSRSLLLAWGKGTVVERGSAEISLKVSANGSYDVYELRTDGSRTNTVASYVEDGRLNFTVTTDGPDGGRIYYEIVRR